MCDENGKPKDGSTKGGSGAGPLGDLEAPEERTVVKGIPPPSTGGSGPVPSDDAEEKTVVKTMSSTPQPAGKRPAPVLKSGHRPPPVRKTDVAKPPKTLAALVAELSRATKQKLKNVCNDGPADTTYWYWRASDQHFAFARLAAEIVSAAARENVPDGRVLTTENKSTDQSSSPLGVELICSNKEVFWRAKKDVETREDVIAAELKKNNEETWDWITWETLGNPGKDYRRSDRMRRLGLYKLSYDRLRRANDGADKWAPASTQGGEIGGGRVRVHVLEDLDYSSHKSLIKTFLPGFSVDGGRLVEPAQRQGGTLRISRVLSNTADSSLSLIMPYNYDDNRMGGRTLGTEIANLPGYNEKTGCGRLDRELDRWSTASRSMIVAFDSLSKSEQLHKDRLIWPWRNQGNTQEIIDGDPDDMLLSDYVGLNTDREFYSVKTGVTFVGKAEETSTGKDLLESNSLHAMYRSRLIDGICRKYPSAMAGTRFQLEILTVTIERPNPAEGGGKHWDGFQIRNIPGVKRNQIWFPGTAIPNHGKAFAQCATGDKTDGAWQEFWQTSFAEALGRAKAQMLVYCGLQHMTANAQNMLAIFSRGQPGSMGPSTEITLRDVGDTCLNDTFFDVLRTAQDPDVQKLFNDMWSKETASADHGVFLAKGDWGKYSPPYVTRTMGQSVFFMQRFFQELSVEDDSQRCKLALRWNVALNESFMDYMREKIGYPSPITVTGKLRGYIFDEKVPNYGKDCAAIWDELESQAFICEATKGTYPQLVPKLQKLSRGVRQNLLFEMWTKIQDILNSSEKLSEKEMQYLGSAHELLIGIEIDEWVKTPEGKNALLALHGG